MKTIMHDPAAQTHYETKRLWQRVHEPICKMAPAICGHNYAIFRSRETGAFSMSTWQLLTERHTSFV